MKRKLEFYIEKLSQNLKPGCTTFVLLNNDSITSKDIGNFIWNILCEGFVITKITFQDVDRVHDMLEIEVHNPKETP